MNTIELFDIFETTFHYGDIPEAWYKGYDASNWKKVHLPHDWSVEMPFSKEYSSGTGYLAGGIGWYRLEFVLPEAYKSQKITLCFDGVYKNAQVWCNSYYKGKRPNGYIPFSYDITDDVVYGEENRNVICVRVDHTDIADSRWFTGSGITRKVSIRIENAITCVENGIFFTTPVVSNDEASLHIQNEISNGTLEECMVEVTNVLLDASWNLVGSYSKSISVGANQIVTCEIDGLLSNPHLWSPSNPYRYALQTILSYTTPSGKSVHSVVKTQMVGIRSYHFDADQGFFLNEQSMKLKGVCLHHDAGCLGAAVLPAVWERRLHKLKAMGCNAIRMSHNPHMPELYDLCDSLGFLVIDEAFDEWENPKNKWSTGHNVYPPKHEGYAHDFPEWYDKDLTALVRRDRNHPSVILWSIGNEIDYPNDPYCHPLFTTMTGNNDANKPAAERQYTPDRPNASRLTTIAKKLTSVVKVSDTTRPVTLAAAFPELSTKLGFIDCLDVVGYNYKEHLYRESHSAFPEKPFLGSENSHDYQAWLAVQNSSYISGQFLWTGIDYLGEASGWPTHGSPAGLLTLAGFEKPSYYRRQSFWSETPVIHLLTGREDEGTGEYKPVSELWNYNEGESIEVRIYTNTDEAELFLNGASLGKNQRDTSCDHISFIVPFVAGDLQVNGFIDSKVVASHTLYTNSAATTIMLHDWATGLGSQGSLTQNSLHQNSLHQNSLHQIEVVVTDSNGYPVLTDSTMLQVCVENGRLLGIENGDLSDCTDYTSLQRRTYHGQLLIYVIADDDATAPMKITVSGEYLKTSNIII